MFMLAIGLAVGVALTAVVLFLNPAWSLKRAAWLGDRLESKLGPANVEVLKALAAKLDKK